MLNVEPPPAGEAKQSAQVQLSDGRTLDANLNFSGVFPALQVSYNDPTLAPETAAVANETAVMIEETGKSKPIRFEKEITRLASLFTGWETWLQPAKLTAAFAVLLITAFMIFKFASHGTVTAAELLNRSAEAESAALTNRDRVLHRTLNFEEHKP